MNFIGINDSLVNLDNVKEIKETDKGVKFTFVNGTCTVYDALFEDVRKVIDDITHRNRRVRIDGLKGETLNVKVVNK